MSEETLARAHDRLRAKLKIDPPLKAKLAVEDDEIFGTLIREEPRVSTNDKGEESHYEVAILGEANLDGPHHHPQGMGRHPAGRGLAIRGGPEAHVGRAPTASR